MRRIFVDTSAWYAYANRHDRWHQEAKEIIETDDAPLLVTSITVISEFLSVLRVRTGAKESIQAQELLLNEPRMAVETHEMQDFHKATALFKTAPRHASFVDCLNVTTAQRLKIQEILAFDPWFKTTGLTTLP